VELLGQVPGTAGVLVCPCRGRTAAGVSALDQVDLVIVDDAVLQASLLGQQDVVEAELCRCG